MMILVLQINKLKTHPHMKATYTIPVLSFINNSEPPTDDFLTVYCILLINCFINIHMFIDACA